MSRAALNGSDEDGDDPLAPVEVESDDDVFTGGAAGSGKSDNLEEAAGSDADMAMVDGEVAEDDDEEIDSDEAFDDADIEKFKSFKFFGSKKARNARKDYPAEDDDDNNNNNNNNNSDMEDVDEPNAEDVEEKDLGNDEGAEVGSEDFLTEDSESDGGSASTVSTSLGAFSAPTTDSSKREALKAILANDTAAVASNLSAAADSDAKKGKAVKQQYQTFDRLLDARIKLQKGFTATNGLKGDGMTASNNLLAMVKAEEAALNLWSTIESIRHSFLDAQSSANGTTGSGKKRKRPSIASTETSTAELWTRIEGLESVAFPSRRTTLDKWSAKARAMTALPAPKSQLIDRGSTSITSVLDTYLASESDRLVADASTAASDTIQSSYNDSPFYQSLLRDLIASRSATSNSTISNTTSDVVLPSATHFNTRGSKHKTVDTKASKGRKVRYTVHEKLQNFAAEEERGTWEESARREFFGSLFGNRRALDEVVDGAGNAEDETLIDGEAEALRLFRSQV